MSSVSHVKISQPLIISTRVCCQIWFVGVFCICQITTYQISLAATIGYLTCISKSSAVHLSAIQWWIMSAYEPHHSVSCCNSIEALEKVQLRRTSVTYKILIPTGLVPKTSSWVDTIHKNLSYKGFETISWTLSKNFESDFEVYVPQQWMDLQLHV